MWLTGRNYIAHRVRDNITWTFHSVFIERFAHFMVCAYGPFYILSRNGCRMKWLHGLWSDETLLKWCAYSESSGTSAVNLVMPLYSLAALSPENVVLFYCFKSSSYEKVGFSDSSIWNRFVLPTLRAAYCGLLQGENEASVSTWQDKPNLFSWLRQQRSPHFIFIL